MGQPIEVSSIVLDEVAVFDCDRTITGQDGAAFVPGEVGDPDAGDFAALLARRLFDADPSLDHLFVASNQVVARRPGGWDEASLEVAGGVIRGFFVFYAG